jgi:predicted enzyme related to lactoylglutathione lyase
MAEAYYYGHLPRQRCVRLPTSKNQENQMAHPVVHFEIGCKDLAKTQEFYQQLFDWKIDAMGPAAMIAAEADGITGHITALGHEPHHYTIFYVGVDDVAAALQKANALGAKTLVPPVDIPTGTFAWFQDLEGNTVGLWKPKQ